MKRAFVVAFLIAVGFSRSTCLAWAPPVERDIQASILKGRTELAKIEATGGRLSLQAYALLKSDPQKNVRDPIVQKGAAAILARIVDGVYRPVKAPVYTAGLDIMLLEAIDPVQYRPQIQIVAGWLIDRQKEHGGWFYLDREDVGGDTSMVQYALLGLWAAERAGADIPVAVWEKAFFWHQATQLSDGTFCYNPNSKENIEYSRSSPTMTLAGASNLLIIRYVLFPGAPLDDSYHPRRREDQTRFGGRGESVRDQPLQKPRTKIVDLKVVDRMISRAVSTCDEAIINSSHASVRNFRCYFRYASERVGALVQSDLLGNKNWYEIGSEELLGAQLASGRWKDPLLDEVSATSLALLFLARATATVVPDLRYGGGLQVAGRGLSDNLAAIGTSRKPSGQLKGSLDEMLTALESAREGEVQAVQEAVLETIQHDQKNSLIGQIPRLRKLARDPRSEVRMIAMWALGRSTDLSSADVLIQGLSDPNEAVLREASFALSMLSRRTEMRDLQNRPLPLDPLEDLSESSTDDQRQQHLSQWSERATKAWTAWWLKVRPYPDRDDEFHLQVSLK